MTRANRPDESCINDRNHILGLFSILESKLMRYLLAFSLQQEVIMSTQTCFWINLVTLLASSIKPPLKSFSISTISLFFYVCWVVLFISGKWFRTFLWSFSSNTLSWVSETFQLSREEYFWNYYQEKNESCDPKSF